MAMNAEQIVKTLLEEKKRFFVYEPDKERNSKTDAAWAYRPMSVLDRETIVNRKYKVMATNLHYLDALELARQLNANPESVGTENPDDFDPDDFLNSVLGKDDPEAGFKTNMRRPGPMPHFGYE